MRVGAPPKHSALFGIVTHTGTDATFELPWCSRVVITVGPSAHGPRLDTELSSSQRMSRG